VTRALLVSPAADLRLARAAAWLSGRGRDEHLLLMGATAEAPTALARSVAAARGATFGWGHGTLGTVASELARAELAARGLVTAGPLALEALMTRVVAALRREGRLGRLQSVADFPGLPRALARTVTELRLAGIAARDAAGVSEDVARVQTAYDAELVAGGVADRALVLRIAAEVVRGRARPERAFLLLDVPVHTALERDLCAALVERAPSVLATVPEGDGRSAAHLAAALGCDVELARPLPARALSRLQVNLFSGDAAPEGVLDGDVVVFSAPGESRECVEIARLLQREAGRGVPFDRMAILLRAPAQYRRHVEEALGRADVPAHFARGTIEPDPSGRAFAALLACADEGLSARRFAEYLSLGQVPDATGEGEPPPAAPREVRWVAPDDELARARGAVDDDALDAALADVAQRSPSTGTSTSTGGGEAVTVEGSLRAPRRWERLLVETSVIGGLSRWESRLEAAARKLAVDLEACEVTANPAAERARRSLSDLAALRGYALPLLRELAALPDEATWGEWIDVLGALATRALRKPARVLSLLGELTPMADVGPVDRAAVRRALGQRLTELSVLPSERVAGRVFVAPVEAARGLAFDVVFVPGVAERIFPAKVTEEPILRDAARRTLGLDTNDERIAAERLALRIAVGAARHRLFLSYPRVDLDQGRPRVPSFYALEVVRAAEGTLPGFDELARRAESRGGARIGWPAPDEPDLAIDEAEYDLALLERLFRLPEERTVGTARYLLSANPHLARALRFRARRWTVRKWMSVDGLVDPTGRARTALDRHALAARSYSATALQQFAVCPYQFLLGAVHRLSPREVAAPIDALEPMQRGSLVHEALYELCTALAARDLLPVTPANLDDARGCLDAAVGAVADRYRVELAPAIPRVWDDAIAALRTDLGEWLRRAAGIAVIDPGWTPWRYELAFGLAPRDRRDPSSQPEPVVLDGGLRLRGSIDLVERTAAGALRATDHKTGKPASDARGMVIDGGRVLQPLLYALALEKLFPESPVLVGRLYYCTAAGGFEAIEIPLDDEARAAAAQVATTVSAALDEGFLPAAPAPDACAPCAYRPVCGPYEEIRIEKKNPERLTRLLALRAHR
jgi:CRISPR/Cas system-associated exonuclease Cas4 (RecB family)